jgi:hypothetical protein
MAVWAVGAINAAAFVLQAQNGRDGMADGIADQIRGVNLEGAAAGHSIDMNGAYTAPISRRYRRNSGRLIVGPWTGSFCIP